jgi:hypothetical protein
MPNQISDRSKVSAAVNRMLADLNTLTIPVSDDMLLWGESGLQLSESAQRTLHERIVSTFDISLPWDAFTECRTFGELVDEILRRLLGRAK